MKIKDLKKWCDSKDDEEVVFSCEYDYHSEAYTHPMDVRLKTRPPQKINFKHEECKYFELVEIKGESRKFCNRKNEFFNEYYSNNSCGEFESDKNVNYCKECESCHKGTSSCPLGNSNSIFIGKGIVEHWY